MRSCLPTFKIKVMTGLTVAALATSLVGTAMAVQPATKPATAASHETLHGTFRETAIGAALGYNLAGAAKLTVLAATTVANVNVSGLDPAKQYGSHLHNGTCAAGGGGHYQNSGTLATPPNELWLSSSNNPLGSLAPNSGGVAHGSGSANWVARLTSTTQTNARSIVIHEPGGARIACADLT
jgi:hypothetical protein